MMSLRRKADAVFDVAAIVDIVQSWSREVRYCSTCEQRSWTIVLCDYVKLFAYPQRVVRTAVDAFL